MPESRLCGRLIKQRFASPTEARTLVRTWDSRQWREFRLLAILLILGTAFGCRPKDQTMLVVYVSGDVFLPDLRSSPWIPGKSVDCAIASRTSVQPEKGRDLLLCGRQSQDAWLQGSWLRGDIRSQFYDNARPFFVTFHSNGHAAGRYHPSEWSCTRTPEAIDCE